jgi:ATP-binding cassette subfamily B multidrug efflux pump
MRILLQPLSKTAFGGANRGGGISMSNKSSSFHGEEMLGKAYDSRLMKRLLRYARRYWKLFLLAVFLLLASTLADLARPYLTQIAIDDGISTGDTQLLGLLGLVFIGIIIAGFIFNFLQIYVLSYAGQSVIFNIRQEIFSHLQKMPLSFFDRNPIGRLVTRVTNDTETLNEMYTNVLVSLLKDTFILLGSVTIMFKMNAILAFIAIAMLPVVVLITVFFRARIRVIYRMVRVSLARINSVLSENISGIRVIQIFRREKEKFEEFCKINNDYYRAVKKQIITFGIFRPAVEMVSSLAVALMIWFGGLRVLEGTVEFGVLFAFINYTGMLFQPINDLAEKYNILQSAMASSERIFVILDSQAEEDTGNVHFDAADLKGSIEFKNVWFAYKEDEWVLKDVSFSAAPGTTTAIVGATGAGKTSIINLLNRFYEIQKGDIYIDGVNIRQVSKASLRRLIGVVLQDVFLFSGTVKENIRLNNLSVHDSDVKRVSEYVNADTFISKLPSGYDEEVKERGATFSSGQRQLLAFARALAFSPPILVLDEATANIDTETEVLIQDALKKITHNRTTIVIAHRLSTIQHADNIIVMHKGRIKEMGSHQELLAKKGMYYNLYRLQYKNV